MNFAEQSEGDYALTLYTLPEGTVCSPCLNSFRRWSPIGESFSAVIPVREIATSDYLFNMIVPDLDWPEARMVIDAVEEFHSGRETEVDRALKSALIDLTMVEEVLSSISS
jgi:hypothetical protein